MYVGRLPSPVVPALLAGMLVLAPQSLPACGWWGDSTGESGGAVVVGPEGEVVKPTEPDSPEEMARLSRAYRVGDGVPKDSILARLWARRAAEAGHAGTRNDLGQMLEAGIGGCENQADAVTWYHKAAEQGIHEAQHSLAMMLRAGRGANSDPTAADRWLRRSGAQGHASAAVDLATRIWSGEIAPQEPEKGCFWWLVALRQGHAGKPDRCREECPNLSDEAFRALEARAAAWQRRISSAQEGDR